MAYNITLTNSTALISGGLPDGQIDTANSSLTLVGKNYPGYGIFLNQNMVRLMENFANGSAPTAPLPGQLWWDNSIKNLKINTSSTKGTAAATWKTITTMTSSSSYTGTPVVGEQWWDTTNQQLKVWSGSAWSTIGPAAASNTGNTGAIPDTIVATSPSTTYVVLKFYIDNTLVGIWSKESSFTTAVSGFATINRGLNLSTAISQAFYGITDVSNNLNVSGISVPANKFLRNDQTGAITGALSLTNDSGLTVGAASNFQNYVSSGDGIIRNTTNNGSIIINVNQNSTQIPVFKANAVSGLVEAYSNPTAGSNGYSLATVNYVNTVLGGGTGTSTFAANIVPSANLTYSLGSSTAWFANVWADTFRGTSITAQYADLAERFEADQPYDPGTVVKLGGVKEITSAKEELSEDVFGVISTRAAYLMNGGAGSDETHPPVAVSGRVPVKVIGKVLKGDRLVSAGNGLARSAARNEISPWNVIGRSLQNKSDSGEGTVEAIVKLSS
jgi:hypothetical protein